MNKKQAATKKWVGRSLILACLMSAFGTTNPTLQTQAQARSAPVLRTDLVVYGCTSGGIATAVSASRKGLSVTMVCPEMHIGAMQAEGLTWVDFGYKEGIGGIAREYYRRMKAFYDDDTNWRFGKRKEYPFYNRRDDTMWQFEPHVAERMFETMLAETNINVIRGERLDRQSGVTKRGTRIVSLRTLSGKVFQARMFADATFEGDLMAAAGVTFTVGRESNARYGETINGNQINNGHTHQFDFNISPYIVANDPLSGVLPGVHTGDPGKQGEGDKRMQAYNFRVCMTQIPENRVPFPRPVTYDARDYELLGRYLDAGWREIYRKFDPVPNGKTDTNNHGGFSTDFIGANYDYPEGSYQVRQRIFEAHKNYQQGLHWFMANDPRVPADVRERMSKWGLCKDEYPDNGHWPRQLYIREARRMVSDFVMTELHIRRIRPVELPVAIGTHNMDSHHVQRYINKDGFVRNEGDVQVNPGGPYSIDYRSIIPRRGQVSNLVVPVAISASHIAYGSIRMEPVFMSLGQAAGTAAALAVRANVSLHDVDYSALRRALETDKQVVEMPNNWDWRKEWSDRVTNPNEAPSRAQQ